MAEGREDVIEYKFLRGRHYEMVVIEFGVASAAEFETFRFKRTYKMAHHGSSENGLNRAEGHTEYKELCRVLREAVVGFAHLYANGVLKCTFLATLTIRPIHNLEVLECLHPPLSITAAGVQCNVTSFPDSLAQPKPRIFSTIG